MKIKFGWILIDLKYLRKGVKLLKLLSLIATGSPQFQMA